MEAREWRGGRRAPVLGQDDVHNEKRVESVGRKGVTVVLVAGGLVAAFLSGKAMAAPSLPTQAEASVVRVVDGDTLVASIGGTDTTVRLLNIDTPETKDPTAPAECLGAEATDYLSDLLAPGDRIELSFDQVRLDPYGRTLAGVHHDGQLVNAEIARAGFGVAVLFEPNRRFYPEVLRAQEEAAGRSVGLFAPTVDCSVAGQLESSTTEATDAATTTVTTVQQADAALAHVDDVLLRGLVLAKALDVERDVVRRAVLTALSSAHRHAHQSALDALRKKRTDLSALRDRLLVEDARKVDAAQAKVVATVPSATPVPTPKPAASKPAPKPAASKPAPKPAAKPKPAASKPKVAKPKVAKKAARPKVAKKKAPSKYTGPRCYAPGGKTWRPC